MNAISFLWNNTEKVLAIEAPQMQYDFIHILCWMHGKMARRSLREDLKFHGCTNYENDALAVLWQTLGASRW